MRYAKCVAARRMPAVVLVADLPTAYRIKFGVGQLNRVFLASCRVS
jgi:hypothetical protein